MEKKALLVYGKPREIDDILEFHKNTKRNLLLIQEVANSNGYSVDKLSINQIFLFLTEKHDLNKDFLFYFTGHANKDYLGDKSWLTNDILSKINEFNGKKLIILDSCSGNYAGGENFEALNLPKNSKIISAKEVYDNKSLAKLVYDAVVIRKKDLDGINKQTFEDMKHNWVYFKETK